jgi:hypothetical protein
MTNPTTPQFALAILFLLMIIAIYIWDATTLATGRSDLTVSALLKVWSKDQPILPFAAGMLVGHIFW